MNEITTILTCLQPLLGRSTYRQLLVITRLSSFTRIRFLCQLSDFIRAVKILVPIDRIFSVNAFITEICYYFRIMETFFIDFGR